MNYYQLTYAGIPFVTDRGLSFSEGDVPAHRRDARELMDEIERLIPLRWLQDFAPLGDFPGRALAGIAYPNPVSPQPNPTTVKVGEWFYPNNMTRWSVFRGLATSAMAKDMLAETNGSAAKTFVMKEYSSVLGNSAEPDFTLTTNMYMLPPRPLAETAGVQGLYLITLVDERYYWQGQDAGVFKITNNVTCTWASLVTAIAARLGITISLSAVPAAYGIPEADSPLWSDHQSITVLLDAIAANIGRTVVRNLDGTYALLTPSESMTRVTANRGPAGLVQRTAGGDLFQSGVSQLPIGTLGKSRNAIAAATVRVCFTKYIDGDDPVPHYLNPRYENQRPGSWFEDAPGAYYPIDVPAASGGILLTSGLVNTSVFTARTTAKALYADESVASPRNLSGITSQAMQIATDYWGHALYAALDEVYPGTYAWSPEGFHDILWTYSDRLMGSFTRIMRGEWNTQVSEFQHAAPPFSGYSPIARGMGGPSVAQTWGGNSGYPATSLLEVALPISGGTTLTVTDQAGFPTNQRWRGKIDNEILLMEGTSGGKTIGIVYRAIDGTIQNDHNTPSAFIQKIEPSAYGVNFVEYGPGVMTFPNMMTSGGIYSVKVLAQTQTVRALVGSGAGVTVENGILYDGLQFDYNYSGAGGHLAAKDSIYLVERNGQPPVSGQYYDGQLLGYSFSGGTGPRPLYAINIAGTGGGGLVSGTLTAIASALTSAGGFYTEASGYPYPLQSNVVYNLTSSFVYPLQSAARVVVSGCFAYPICSNVYNMTSNYPYPLGSSLRNLPVGSAWTDWPYPLRSDSYVTVSGPNPFPQQSNQYNLPVGGIGATDGWTQPLRSDSYIVAPGGADAGFPYPLRSDSYNLPVGGGGRGFPYPLKSDSYTTVPTGADAGFPYPLRSDSYNTPVGGGGRGWPYPLRSDSYVIVPGGDDAGFPYPLRSDSYNLPLGGGGRGWPYPLRSNSYNTVSGYPYPLQSAARVVVSGCFAYPICSNVYNTASGYPYPLRSDSYITPGSSWPYPLRSNTYTFQDTLINVYPMPSGYLLLASGIINNFHFGDLVIYNNAIASGAVRSGAVASGQIGFGHLANGAVRSGTIGSGQIGRSHIASGVIPSPESITWVTKQSYAFNDDFLNFDSGYGFTIARTMGSGEVIHAIKYKYAPWAASGLAGTVDMRLGYSSGVGLTPNHSGAYADSVNLSAITSGRPAFSTLAQPDCAAQNNEWAVTLHIQTNPPAGNVNRLVSGTLDLWLLTGLAN